MSESNTYTNLFSKGANTSREHGEMPITTIMKLKCKARRYLSLFSCNCVSHMTNHVNFKLSKDVEKNPGPTQYVYNTDHHEVINNNRPFIQNHSSTIQLTSPIYSENLMQSRLGELGLQSINNYWTRLSQISKFLAQDNDFPAF